MDVHEAVRAHYAGGDLAAVLLGALRAQGVDTDHLTVDELARVDQLHAGFLPATRHLLDALQVTEQTRLLDVGCGIGGATRVAAADHGCTAVGVDLSPDFVAAAQGLSHHVGLDGLVSYAVTDGVTLPFDDDSFDVASMIHVGMNVPDKTALFREVHRVLVRGARFGVYEQMRVGDGPLTYPLPWAVDPSTSFVETAAAYETALTDAGFTVAGVEDRTAQVAGPPPGVAPPGGRAAGGPEAGLPIAVFGPEFVLRIQNNIAATQAGLLAAVQILATAPR